MNKFYERVLSRTSQRLQFITRFIRFVIDPRIGLTSTMRKKRIQGRRSLGTITRLRRADRNLHFTSSLQYYSSRENENFTFTFHLVLSYPESFDEKLTSNLILYEIGLHLREEKEIQAQRRMERKKEKKSTFFQYFARHKQIHLLVLPLKKGNEKIEKN